MDYFKRRLESWIAQDLKTIEWEDFTFLAQDARHSTSRIYAFLVQVIEGKVIASSTLEVALSFMELLDYAEKILPREEILTAEDRVRIYNIHSWIFEKYKYLDETFLSEIHESITVLYTFLPNVEQEPDIRTLSLFQRLTVRAIGTILYSSLTKSGLLRCDIPPTIKLYLTSMFGKPLPD